MARIDIVNMRSFKPNVQAIDIALPVLAYECEASLPIENSLDAYEEVVLKLTSLGLGTKSIANSLCATESLVDGILARLEFKEYVTRGHGSPWHLTEHGEAYLSGTIQERASSESQYGYMFVNAIKKEVLPYFLRGDVGQLSLFDTFYEQSELPQTLTVSGDEERTFEAIEIRQSRLRDAYQRYFRNLDILRKLSNGDITKEDAQEEALDPFADLDSLEEEIDDSATNVEPDLTPSGSLNVNMTIRLLRREPAKLYLRMRVVINPSIVGGYSVESPFDMGGIDDSYFLGQIQWLEHSDAAYIGGMRMEDFISREINKIGPRYTISETDFSVFVIQRMPQFRTCREHAPHMFDNMRQAYALMQSNPTLLEKENIVGTISRYVVERLLNTFFRQIGSSQLEQVKRQANRDIRRDGSDRNSDYKKQLCRCAHLPEAALEAATIDIRKCPAMLTNTYGNSIIQKITNMLIVNLYLGNPQVAKFLSNLSHGDGFDGVVKLNSIRIKVSHDTDDIFTADDYDQYMDRVFGLINELADALWGE